LGFSEKYFELQSVLWLDETEKHFSTQYLASGVYYRAGEPFDIFVKLQFGCHPVAVVQYTFTNKQYTERYKTNNTQNNTTIFGTMRAVPRLCELYPGICLTTEERARKNLSQGSRRVPAGTVKIHKYTIRIYRQQ